MDRDGTGVELAVGNRNSRAVSSESVLSQCWWWSITKHLSDFSLILRTFSRVST